MGSEKHSQFSSQPRLDACQGKRVKSPHGFPLRWLQRAPESGRRLARSPQQLFLLGLGVSSVCSFAEKQESSRCEEL